MISFELAILARLTVLATSLATAAPVDLSLAGPVERVAASDMGLVVVTATGIHVLDPLGHRIRTLFSPAARSNQRRRASDELSGFSSLPGLLEDSNWGGAYDLDDIDDPDDPRLADETTTQPWELDLDPRRSGSASVGDVEQVPVVAASGGWAWIGRADGLWRVDIATGTTTRLIGSRRGGVRALAAGSDGRTVAVIEGQDLLRSDDGGITFEHVGPPSTSPRALAVSARGSIFVIDLDEVYVVYAGQTRFEPTGLAHALDVASCGANVIVLADGTLLGVSEDRGSLRVEKVGGAPTGTRRIACGTKGGLLIAHGSEPWTSLDGGRSWSTRDDLPPVVVRDAAATSTGFWVATPSGLMRLPPSTPMACSDREPLERLAVAQEQGDGASSGLARPSGATWRWWYMGLPRVDLSFATAQTAMRRDLRALVVFTFVLSGQSARVRQAVRAGEAVRRELAPRAAQLIVAGALPGCARAQPTSPISTDERHALTRILEDHP